MIGMRLYDNDSGKNELFLAVLEMYLYIFV